MRHSVSDFNLDLRVFKELTENPRLSLFLRKIIITIIVIIFFYFATKGINRLY